VRGTRFVEVILPLCMPGILRKVDAHGVHLCSKMYVMFDMFAGVNNVRELRHTFLSTAYLIELN
jgi:hypothetical protein